MVKGKKSQASRKTQVKKVKNPLFESKPRNFRVGGDIQPVRDLTRFVRWPKYILLQRQKRILLRRLKVPPTLQQFNATISKDQTKGLFKLMKKYSPETKKEKKTRLLSKAQEKVDDVKGKDSQRPKVLKFGLNHVTTLIENKQAKLVCIAFDVDPIELVLWLPQLCRKMEVPFCFVKNKERLGKLVHQKNSAVVAITEVRKEDQAELDLYAKNFKAAFNDNQDLKKTWGGNVLGCKSQHAEDLKKRLIEKEQLKKAGL